MSLDLGLDTPVSTSSASPGAAPLPRPERTRWQPLRIGLVELFHYDAEEFWFRDGHLLLRGNNGTGKSKVLSLTLPFLFDASLSAVRVEPDGDRSKRMEWNLLMGRYERRVGYTWVEFGRRDPDGNEHYLTLGCGLSAVAGRSRVDAWHFVTEQRVGEELHLLSPERVVMSREKLASALDGRGRIADSARDYKREVDTRLFGLGDRYEGLIETLIQLRQPQLSKKPDEQSLSGALSNALPELPRAVLEDVADAMNQLTAYREELTQIERVRDAVGDFGKRYRSYSQIQARRQARVLRQAQTEFDKHSQALHEASAQRDAAGARARDHERRCEALKLQVVRDRAVLDELKSDPAMRDANRLEELERAARDAQRDLDDASKRAAHSEAQRQREFAESSRRERDLASTREDLAARAQEARKQAELAGIAREHDALAEQTDRGALRGALEGIARRRGEQVQQLRTQLRACEVRRAEREKVETRALERRSELERAEVDARHADQALLQSAARFVDDFRGYLAGLRVLSIADPEAGLAELADWVVSLDGELPLRRLLEDARHEAQAQHAAERSELTARDRRLAADDDALAAEAERLRSGEQLRPLASPTRAPEARADRPGAPLWELVEFREHVPARARAGLEAALEGAGLLDAWVTPQGFVLQPDTHDAWLTPGAARQHSLLDWLLPSPAPGVDGARIEALLASIAADAQEPDADSWISASGQYRVGRLRGAHDKPEALYLGRAAREQARQRRLAELALLRAQIATQRQALAAARELLDERERALQRELRATPQDDALRSAHARFVQLEKLRRACQERLASVEVELAEATERLHGALRALEQDARDLALPSDPALLAGIERALSEYRANARELVAASAALDRAQHEYAQQRERALRVQQTAEADLAASRERTQVLEETCARRDLLRAAVGESVAALKLRLHAADRAVREGSATLEGEQEQLSEAAQARARAEQRVEDQAATLNERIVLRQAAVERLRGFAATGLLGIAARELELPAGDSWTIDPALHLARRIEVLFASVSAEDRDWSRIQDEIGRDYTQLGQSLAALGQRAAMEPTEYGLVVQIVYGNRAERPDLLEQQLASEVEQRRGILSAREREVLENHLQAEVAAYLQRLLREAEDRVLRINDELKRRPTSTGVYFKLEWEALPEGEAGAPVGLAAARARLLRRSSDAWSAEDRDVVGNFLQLRIEAERSANDMGPLVDHLARALDYRHWHRFRVKRWHDGAFRPLSGPASSGERALGLTVPLFAAASSYYESGASQHAPRLVLLDEAFAGIDDEARAHCMALIREFDLDFVMTSEREWGCYATLPGVSICQVVRREGIDGVYVSRWTWDGRARREAPDPDRRLFGRAAT